MSEENKIVTIVNPIIHPQWNKQLYASGKGTVFHTSNWARVLVETYNYHPVYLMLTQQDAFCGCLPIMEVNSILTGKRGVCLSFSDCCGAVANTEDDFRILLESVVTIGRMSGWDYIQFRGEQYLAEHAYENAYAYHELEILSDEGKMYSRLRKGTSSSIRKAEREGVKITISQTLGDVQGFYRLHCLTRKRHGLPPQPSSFFDRLHKHIINEGLGFTVLAHLGNKTVAGLICLNFAGQAVWKYGASDDTYKQIGANNLVLWETIRECVARGFKSLSMGRTDLDNEGLITFKNGWGASRTSLSYYRYDFVYNGFISERKTRGKIPYRKILRYLPVDLLRVIGEVAYRHMG